MRFNLSKACGSCLSVQSNSEGKRNGLSVVVVVDVVIIVVVVVIVVIVIVVVVVNDDATVFNDVYTL